MRYVLDAGAYGALFRGDPRVLARVRRAERLYLPATVVGEILAALRSVPSVERHRRELELFLRSPLVECVPTTTATAERFAGIRAGVDAHDRWVAATALELDAAVLSFTSGFGEVEGLVWADPADGGS